MFAVQKSPLQCFLNLNTGNPRTIRVKHFILSMNFAPCEDENNTSSGNHWLDFAREKWFSLKFIARKKQNKNKVTNRTIINSTAWKMREND